MYWRVAATRLSGMTYAEAGPCAHTPPAIAWLTVLTVLAAAAAVLPPLDVSSSVCVERPSPIPAVIRVADDSLRRKTKAVAARMSAMPTPTPTLTATMTALPWDEGSAGGGGARGVGIDGGGTGGGGGRGGCGGGWGGYKVTVLSSGPVMTNAKGCVRKRIAVA